LECRKIPTQVLQVNWEVPEIPTQALQLKGTTEIFYTGIASITMSLSGVNSPMPQVASCTTK